MKTIDMHDHLRRTLLGCALATALAACGVSSAPTQQLVDARRAYGHAQQSPAAQYTPDDLLTARQALDRAEKAHEDDPGSQREAHLAYIAERKAQIAAAKGEIAQAQQAAAQAKATYMDRLEQRAAQPRPTESQSGTPAAKSLPQGEQHTDGAVEEDPTIELQIIEVQPTDPTGTDGQNGQAQDAAPHGETELQENEPLEEAEPLEQTDPLEETDPLDFTDEPLDFTEEPVDGGEPGDDATTTE